MERILVVEDDQRLAAHVCGVVQSAGFVTQHVSQGQELDECLRDKAKFDAVILDRLLSGTDTKTKVAEMKKRWPRTAVLVLSAINTPLERAELLNLGADDYMGKPFMSQELLARLRALIRRFEGAPANYREIGDLVLDLPRRFLIHGEQQDNLPAKEFLLLKVLSDEMGRVLTKMELLDTVWNGSLDVETNVVESTVANLRKRFASVGSKVLIRNSRNQGYWLEG